MAYISETRCTDASANYSAIYDQLRPFIVDEQYALLSSHLLATGRGRRPTISKLPHTNRLIAQLDLLRHDENKTFEEISVFAEKYLSFKFGDGVPLLSSLIRRVMTKLKNTPCNNWESVLSEALECKKYSIGPFSEQYGISCEMLLNACDSLTAVDEFSNGLCLELQRFAKKLSLQDHCLNEWLVQLCPSLKTCKNIKYKLTKLRQHHSVLLTRLPKPNGQMNLDLFLNESFSKELQTLNNANTSCTPVRGSCQDCVVLKEQLESIKHELAAYKKKIACMQECKTSKSKMEIIETEFKILKEVSIRNKADSDQKIQLLSEKIEELSANLSYCLAEKINLTKELASVNDKFKKKIRNSAAICRQKSNLKRTKEALKFKEKLLKQRLEQQSTPLTNLIKIKKTLCETKKKLSKSIQTVADLKCKLRESKEQIQALNECTEVVNNSHLDIVTRDESGKFTDSVVKCVGSLVGGGEVSGKKAKSIIQTVASHLLNTEIADANLPSKSTVYRISRTCHTLAKMQVCDELRNKRFDIHIDGTSRDQHKYVGHQVTLEDSSQLSLGFQSVYREDAKTLLDTTMLLMHQIGEAGKKEGENVDDIVKEIFQNLVGTMTDRARTMKAYGKALDEKRKCILETDSGLEFLFCNAHFLLGLSSETEKVLTSFEEAQGWRKKLGRDKSTTFQRFRSSANEAAACRLIRTTCDVLGPRGDEKNGCREEWLAFCCMNGLKSKIGSFRSNRFNNLFEGAAAIVHHHDHIVNFIDYCKQDGNLKIQSVLQDLQSQEIMLMVVVLATVYVCMAGPFWGLVHSQQHYLDMYQHIQCLEQHLKHVSMGPDFSQCFDDLPSWIDTFMMRTSDTSITTSVSSAVDNLKCSVQFQNLLQSLCKGYLMVTERQLGDFLEGGKYSGPSTDEQRKKMAHCQMNNLLGEACFGDLDFSMFKRRNCSLFHHTTVNMMKRNHPIEWLKKKSTEEQALILKDAKKKSKNIYSTYESHEMENRKQLQVHLQEKKKRREEKVARLAKTKLDVIKKVQNVGGPCLDRAAITNLLQACHTITAKRNALQLQIRYHRLIMGAKSKDLKIKGKDINTLVDNLCKYLQEDMSVSDSAHAEHLVDAGSSLNETEAARTTDVDNFPSSSPPKRLTQDGGFTSQGERVAVYYDSGFFIGEVLEVHSSSSAKIIFMEQYRNKNIFKWGDTMDCDDVDAKFVFKWGLSMETTNGRTWTAADYGVLQEEFSNYKNMYCD